MRTRTRDLWPLVVVLGVGFALLNLVELVFLDSGSSEVAGLAIGIAVVGLGLVMSRGWLGAGE